MFVMTRVRCRRTWRVWDRGTSRTIDDSVYNIGCVGGRRVEICFCFTSVYPQVVKFKESTSVEVCTCPLQK